MESEIIEPPKYVWTCLRCRCICAVNTPVCPLCGTPKGERK